MKPRQIVYDNVYRICMNSKSGRILYLEVQNIIYKKDDSMIPQYGWTYDKGSGMRFETEQKAKELANNYFKNFDKWFISCKKESVGSI
ncbi:hypothetical protein [uncultured Clostridium sp.]|uniref:hypothetical protein n=1 Tax=uncultured Clostridium sp. TaxID=59620 RepID=UPI00260F6829|nr:hypothetical protein [uncultured Clostridium sp.]